MEDDKQITQRESAPRTRKQSFSLALERLLEYRWPVALFQILNGIALIFIGRMLALNTETVYFVPVLVGYVLVFGLIHYLIIETPKQIKDRADAAAKKEAAEGRTELRVLMDTYFMSEKFLTARLRRMISVLSSIRLAPEQAIANLNKVELINSALRDLCDSLTAIRKDSETALRDVRFRATFMEVRIIKGEERLTYAGWHTWEESPPKSLTIGKTFMKGEGCAGRAWQRNRAVIEDEFRDGHEWVDNYPDQGTRYKSMISVPIRSGTGADPENVLGVITVDTQISGHFGKKDDREQEDRMSALILPYGTYVALICEIENVISVYRGEVKPANVSASLEKDESGQINATPSQLD